MEEALIQWQEQELTQTGRYYKHICWMVVPLLWMSCYFYGPRPLLLCGVALLVGNLCDRLISLLRRRVYQPKDYSNESFALIIALLMPATVDWYVLVAAVLAGVLIGKEVFGGYGSYPFHPAAVGYVVAAVSWPEQVFRYPQPYASIPLWDASGVAVSSTISDTLRSGGTLNISTLSLGLGEYAAPMGTGAALVLVACGLFLWVQKDIRLSATLSFLITSAVIVFLFPRQVGLDNGPLLMNLAFRLRCVRDELLTGAMLFSAVFLLNEPYTCAHHRRGRIRLDGPHRDPSLCTAALPEKRGRHRRKGGGRMRRSVAEMIVRDPEKYAHHDRVFLNNPVVMQGMGLAPLVVLATTGKNALMLAVSVALLLTPSRMLACLLSRAFPLRDEQPAKEELEKKLLPRGLIYSGSAAVVYLAVYPILNALFGVDLLALGIYLPMLVVEPMLIYRFGRVQETMQKAVSKGLRITLGYVLLLLLLGCVREWMALGTVFGLPLLSRPVLPMAGMPAGGFIVLGILCAIWRALAQHRKNYLKTEARNTVAVHHQKEANREHE